MREIHLTCPVCSAELIVWEATEGPVGTCQACGTHIEVPVGAFAVLAARPGQTPAPPPSAEAPAPEVVEGDLVRWDEQADAAPASAPQTTPPQVEATPPPAAPAAEAPVPVAPPELVGDDEEEPAAVVFEIEDEEDREAGARSSTNLDLFEPQGGARGSVVSQYFRRSPYARKWMSARVLMLAVALIVLFAAVVYLLVTM